MLPKISSRTKAIVQRNVNAMLTDRCRIERESGSRGKAGEPLHNWVVVATGVPYREIMAGRRTGSQTRQVGGQEAMVDLPRLIFPTGTSFTGNNRVIDETDGRIWHIVAVEDGYTDAAYVSCQAARVR